MQVFLQKLKKNSLVNSTGNSHAVSYHGTIPARRSLDCRELTRPGVFYVVWPLTMIGGVRNIVISVIDGGLGYFMRRLRDAHIPPRFNRVAVRKASRFVITASSDALIPPAVSQVRCPGHHRESL